MRYFMKKEAFVLFTLSLIVGCTHGTKVDKPLVTHEQEIYDPSWDQWSEAPGKTCDDSFILNQSQRSIARACAYWRWEKDSLAAQEIIDGWKQEGLNTRLLATLEAREFARTNHWEKVIEVLGKYPKDFEALSGEITLMTLALIKTGKEQEAWNYLSIYLDRRKGNYRWEVLASQLLLRTNPNESERRARRGLERAPAGSPWALQAKAALGGGK